MSVHFSLSHMTLLKWCTLFIAHFDWIQPRDILSEFSDEFNIACSNLPLILYIGESRRVSSAYKMLAHGQQYCKCVYGHKMTKMSA